MNASPLRSNPEPREDASDPAESALIDQDTADERAATLGDIARHHHSALVRFLALRTGSAEDAKDVLQESYAKVLALGKPPTSVLKVGFIWRIATNLAIDRKRQRATHSRLASIAMHPAAGFSPSAEAVAESRERLAIVQKAIAQLPPRSRQAFLLRVVEGQRFARVGREMGITERMAKMHVARAMEYLHTCITRAETARTLA